MSNPKLEAEARLFVAQCLRRLGQEPTEEQLNSAAKKIAANFAFLRPKEPSHD